MSRQRRSSEKVHAAVMEDKPQKEKQFKIRVNSFHRTKMDESLYDP
jgi:hypothetical protein